MEQLDARTILLLVALGGSSGALFKDVVQDPRPDPFTGAEAKAMEERLRLLIERTEHQIRVDMPPENTRNRIRSLEQAMGELDEFYSPPTSRWDGR